LTSLIDISAKPGSCRVVLLATAICLYCSCSTAGEVTLSWSSPTNNVDGSPLTNLAGTMLHYGLSTGEYTDSVDVGNVTNATISGLLEGVTYYINGRPYNEQRIYGDFTTEVVWHSPDVTAPSIGGSPEVFLQADTNAQAVLPDLTDDVIVNDNCSATTDILLTQSPVAGTIIGLGDTTVTLTATDEAGNESSFLMTASVSDEPPPLTEIIAIEAEAGEITAPMVTVPDSTASGGAYIESADTNSGSADFTFNAHGGTYIVWALAKAGTPSPNAHDSFFVSMDAESEDVWDLFYDVPGGPSTNWAWDVISMRSGGSWSNNLADPATFQLGAGTHTLRLRGREVFAGIDRILITSDLQYDPASTVNSAPQVNAGEDQEITLPASTVTLDGTVTDDGLPEGMSLTTQWRQVSGPNMVTFGDETAIDTTAAFADVGTYELELTAADGELSSSDIIMITVNSPPRPMPPVNLRVIP